MKLNLNKLNEAQRSAVLHGDGPLLVLAGAGSGKTSTMTYRIAHLITERGNPAGSILGLSFTRKAAEELRERVMGMIKEVAGPNSARGLTVSTFHSLCARILREKAERIGYQTSFMIVDRNDQVDILRGILKHIKVDDRRFDPDRLLFEFGQAKNRFLSQDEATRFFLEARGLPGDYADVAAVSFGHYQAQLRALNSMDFDDLLYNTVRLLEQDEEVRHHYNRKFRHILVDEYQDTNPAQFRMLRLLTEETQNICVVGDDDQSIYSWRGADAAHILQFDKHYKGARIITLDQNYRSTMNILKAANKVIEQNRARHPKTLWSDKGEGALLTEILVEEDHAEAETVAEEILTQARETFEGVTTQIRPWKDFAVLYRSNPQSRLFEEAFRMRGIPYKLVGSMSFLDRKEIKDVLSYWRLVVNSKDDASARRVINWPTRGIGRTSIEALSESALKKGVSFFETLGDAKLIAPRAAEGAHAFVNLVQSLRQKLDNAPLTPEGVAEWARNSLAAIGVKQALVNDAEDPLKAERQWENVDELAHAIGQMKLQELQPASPVDVLREYLGHLMLEAMDSKDENDTKSKAEKDQVTLMTLHAAKGLEFPVVFLAGMEEGLLPHKKVVEEGGDISEERRLCYVGITRAKQKLYLLRTRNRIRYGKPVPRTLSRFLQDIPKELLESRDRSETAKPTAEVQAECEQMLSDFLAQLKARNGRKSFDRSL